MWSAIITSILQLFGWGAKAGARQQDILNSKEMQAAKKAREEQAMRDSVHKSTQKDSIEEIGRDFER